MKFKSFRSTGSWLLFAAGLFALSGSLFAAYGQKEFTIAEIQGDKAVSPHNNESVRVTGVVTAILKKGFLYPNS